MTKGVGHVRYAGDPRRQGAGQLGVVADEQRGVEIPDDRHQVAEHRPSPLGPEDQREHVLRPLAGRERHHLGVPRGEVPGRCAFGNPCGEGLESAGPESVASLGGGGPRHFKARVATRAREREHRVIVTATGCCGEENARHRATLTAGRINVLPDIQNWMVAPATGP